MSAASATNIICGYVMREKILMKSHCPTGNFPFFYKLNKLSLVCCWKNSGLLLEIKRMLSFSLSYSEEASGVSNFTEVQRPVAIFPKWLLCLSSHPLQSVTSRQNSEDTIAPPPKYHPMIVILFIPTQGNFEFIRQTFSAAARVGNQAPRQLSLF